VSHCDIANGVIVGENDSAMRGMIRSVLLQTGLQIFLAADGLEALQIARQFRARLVLLDIGMPRLNGLQACQQIRALPGYAAVPIIMLTGYNDERMRQASSDVGASEFITKPVRPDELLRRLAKHLDLLGKPGPPGAFGVGESGPMRNGRETLHVLRNMEGGD